MEENLPANKKYLERQAFLGNPVLLNRIYCPLQDQISPYKISYCTISMPGSMLGHLLPQRKWKNKQDYNATIVKFTLRPVIMIYHFKKSNKYGKVVTAEERQDCMAFLVYRALSYHLLH